MGVKVLIVDDERDYSETMEFWLMAKGYEVTALESGAEALRYLEDNSPPDIIFLDVLMPGMNGLETLRLLKEAYPGLPVIMVTAFSTGKAMAEAKRLGAAGVFGKADDFAQAARLIKETLEMMDGRGGTKR